MKVLELFAGTRSISKAFEKKGHQTDTIVKLCKGIPDIIWASPDCTTYSIAAISHHRIKNIETGNLDPVSDYANFCDNTNKHVLDLIRELKPKYYFIENPRGRVKKNEFYERFAKIYCYILPIW